MVDLKTFIKDPLGSPHEETEKGGDCSFSPFDLHFFNQVHEFLTANKDGLGSFRSFVEDQTKSCDDTEKQVEIIAAGVGLLNLFIQKNWVGPDIPISEQIVGMCSCETRENVLKQLVVDGENVISAVEVPELLLISKIILESAWSHFESSQPAKIWYLRCLFIHQQILEELSPQLCDSIYGLISEIEKGLNEMEGNEAALCHLEFARVFMYYQNIQKSKVEVEKATKISGIEISLSGALGKRTKFQVQDLAQLILKVDLENGETQSPSAVSSCPHPKDIRLDDEIRLDKIKYADTSFSKYPHLSSLQQAVLLGNLFQTQKSQPKDSLADEELQPLISCILDQPKVWSVRMTTLLLRSKLESNHKRTVERSMMQVQVLSDCLREAEVPVAQRLVYFFVSYLPPKWDVQATLASILVSMGSIKSALEIYESLEDWENVIYCYNVLQLRHKAQEIIEQELKKNPTPKLWCLLGDATDDVSCYEKAWELSNRRSARAQRHLAYFYYYRKKYAECIEHFQKSLEINSLQKELWYRLGYAALVEEKWEISAQAYRRYCVLDPECSEAWNNLGRCYCELKQKYRAWRALQEALKVDYSNWKVWDNYMLVSADLQAFDEVIKSYHEVLNLKEKHLDIPVLNALVMGYKSLKEGGEKEAEKMDKTKFKCKLVELFGRLTSQVRARLDKVWMVPPRPKEIINDRELWFLYSQVIDTDTQENRMKKHQLLMKAHRSAVNKPDWETKLENCNRVIYILSKAVEVGLQTQDPNALLSCKLATTGTLSKVKKLHPDAGISKELEQNLEKLEKILDS